MTIFTVHLPQAEGATAGVDRQDLVRAVFVPDGFSKRAFLFGPFWLLANGLWVAFLVWLVAIVVLSVVGADYLTTAAAYAILIAFEVFLGLEGNNLRRGKLAQRGYRLVDIVVGASTAEAERSFFVNWAAKTQDASPPSPAMRHPVTPPDTHGEVLGHFPLPEGRG